MSIDFKYPEWDIESRHINGGEFKQIKVNFKFLRPPLSVPMSSLVTSPIVSGPTETWDSL